MAWTMLAIALWAPVGPADAPAGQPTSTQLAERCRQSLSWQQSVAMQVRIEQHSEGDLDPSAGTCRRLEEFAFYRDGDTRMAWHGRSLCMDAASGELILEACIRIERVFLDDTMVSALGPPAGMGRPLPMSPLLRLDGPDDRVHGLALVP